MPEAHAFQTFTEQLEIEHSSPVLHFNDTGDTGDITDWFIAGGDLEFFVSETNVATPFSIEKGVPSDSFYMESGGDIGFGTNIPLSALHISRSNPSVRFENTSSGQTWQFLTAGRIEFWDMTANTFPFILTNGAPDASTCIDGSGNIGMGTCGPAASVHVVRSNGTAQLLVEEKNATTAARELFKLSNNGGPFFIFENTDIAQSYSFAMGATGHFLLSHQQTSGVQMRLTPAGNMTIAGSLNEGSSREIKDGITPVDPATVLAKLEALPVSEWSYQDVPGSRHVGPMAEDFHATFGLGPDERHIAPRDLAGVALAAAKALKADNDAKDQRIMELESRMARLEALLAD